MQTPSSERPRFRQDLMAEVVEEGGTKFIDVGDPDNGTVFRFYEVEFAIACGMDGERDIPGIVQWAKDELGVMPSVNEVRNVVATLGSLNFLDQGEARAAARDADLAAGIVVGQQQKRPAAGVDLELGSAGTTAPAAPAPLPKSADIDLGAPGAPVVAKSPRAPVEDVALGAPGARTQQGEKGGADVSLDLADHMGVKPADVKEAVRQSKQMAAVEVPKDLADQLDAPVPPPRQTPKPFPAAKPAAGVEAKPEAKPAEAKPVEAKPVEAKSVEAKPAETKPAETKPADKKPVEAKPADKKPVETKPVAAETRPADKAADKKPDKAADKKPVAPPAPRRGVSPALILLLVLAVAGAGGYFVWRYLLRDKGETAEVAPPPVAPQPVGSAGSAAVAPPPPPPPTAPIEIVSAAERDIVAVFPGVVESVDTNERDVTTSDILARFVGAKKLEGELAALDKEIARRQEALKAATAAHDKITNPPEGGKPPTEAQRAAAEAAMQKAQTALEEKQNQRVEKEEQLEKLYVRAPFDGRVKVLVKPRQKIEENVVVAKITPKPAPSALFKLHKNMTLERNTTVPVKVGERMYTCEIADSTVDGTRVVCSTNNEGLAEGQTATLMIDQH